MKLIQSFDMSPVWVPCLTSIEQGYKYDGTIHVDFPAQAHVSLPRHLVCLPKEALAFPRRAEMSSSIIAFSDNVLPRYNKRI